MVTYQRKPILIDNIEILRTAFEMAKTVYDFEIYASVVLPEHLHLVLNPQNIKEYPKIIRAIKYNFSKMIKDGGIAIPPYAKFSTNIWQRGYWEHTIRDEEDLYKHLDYIHYNPIKHGLAESAKDWAFSSFNKFVKMNYYEENWYCKDNFDKISTMELE